MCREVGVYGYSVEVVLRESAVVLVEGLIWGSGCEGVWSFTWLVLLGSLEEQVRS